MKPKVGESGFGSTGPKEPMPKASKGRRGSKKAATRWIVSAGVVVGISAQSRSSGPVPEAQTNLVPPASMPANRGIGSVYAGRAGWLVSSSDGESVRWVGKQRAHVDETTHGSTGRIL